MSSVDFLKQEAYMYEDKYKTVYIVIVNANSVSGRFYTLFVFVFSGQ